MPLILVAIVAAVWALAVLGIVALCMNASRGDRFRRPVADAGRAERPRFVRIA